MIDSIRLRNFQSHRDTVLELVPGVNVLVGSTDSGKTAVLRGLRWVAENRPLGDSYRSRWGGETEVEVELGSTTVSRIKGSTNLYRVDDQELEGFGTAVPPSVTEALNLDRVALQMQHDLPFLLRESPGEVARVLGQASGLEEIDGTVSWLSGEQRRCRAVQEGLAKEHARTGEAIEALAWVEEMDRAVAEAEALEAEVEEKERVTNNLRHLVWDGKRLTSKLVAGPDLAALGEALGKAESFKFALSASVERAILLRRLVRMASDLTAATAKWAERAAASRRTFEALMPNVCPLCGK